MRDPKGVALAAAVAGGYALGRTKKGRLACTAAVLLLGRGQSARDLLTEGIRSLGAGSETSTGDLGPEREIVRKARELATTAANRRLTSLADALREHTLALSAQRVDDAKGTVGTAEAKCGEEADAQEASGTSGDRADEESSKDEETAEEEHAQPARRRRTGTTGAAGARTPRKRHAVGNPGGTRSGTTRGRGSGGPSAAGESAESENRSVGKSSTRLGRKG